MITLVVPELSGPNTGGTRYNRRLVAALRERGESVRVLDFDAALRGIGDCDGLVWIDSLWLPRLGEWVDAASKAGVPPRFGLLTHYLPALVEHGERPGHDQLSTGEALALRHADGFIAPSEYLAGELRALGVEDERVLVLEPGLDIPLPTAAAEPTEKTRAVVLANIVEGKGIAPLLDALATRLAPNDALQLRIMGSREMEPDYARRCASRAAAHPQLTRCVHFTGPATHEDCIRALLDSDVLLSSSRMESYGMALAEARGCGRPIIARTGGNANAHVQAQWGGQLVPDEAAVADALLEQVRNPELRHQRAALAWQHRRHQPWSATADRLVAALAHWPPPRPPQ